MSTDAASACPVCQWPAANETSHCATCGARLLGRYVIGMPPPQAQRELDRALAEERRRYALRVAGRAAGWLGPDHLASLASLAGGEASAPEDEIDAAAAADEAGEAPAALGVGFTLARLVAGDTRAVEFVEVSPDGLAALALVADEFGVPISQSSCQVSWRDILPGLPADDDLFMYLLAGGSGDAGGSDALAGAELTAAVASAAGREVPRLVQAMAADLRLCGNGAVGNHGGAARPPLARPDTVLVRRAWRWPALEAAITRARDVLRPVAEIVALGVGPLPTIVAEASRRAPLRYDYCLMLAGVDRKTGHVRPQPSLLFPAGTTGRPHLVEATDVPVMAPSAAADRLALPVVARRGDDPRGWPAVGIAGMDGTFPGITRLRIELEAPGQVSMSALPRLVDRDGIPDWPGLLDELPSRVAAAVVADVVLLAELGGDPEPVARRISLLGGVVGELDRPGVKIAVIGYREHWDRGPILVGEQRLADAAKVQPLLAQADLWRAVKRQDQYAAPLEDALERIAKPDWAWRPGAQHLVVVFAARPPYPSGIDARGETLASICPRDLDWRSILERLRRAYDVECMAVLPEGSAEDVWSDFATAGWFSAELASAADIASAIGIDKAGEGARLPLAVDARQAGGEGIR